MRRRLKGIHRRDIQLFEDLRSHFWAKPADSRQLNHTRWDIRFDLLPELTRASHQKLTCLAYNRWAKAGDILQLATGIDVGKVIFQRLNRVAGCPVGLDLKWILALDLQNVANLTESPSDLCICHTGSLTDSTRPSGCATSTSCAIPTKSPVSTTPGSCRIR